MPNDRSTTAFRGQDRRQAFTLAVEIGEGFVDDQHAAAPRKAPMKFEEVGARRDPPVRVVGIDDDGDVEVAHVLDPFRFVDLRAGGGEGRLEAAVGRPQHADGAARNDPGQRLDERLRAGARDHHSGGRAIAGGGRGLELGQRSAPGQPRPELRGRDRAGDRGAD